MKRYFEALFLFFVLCALSYSSGLWFLGLLGVLALLRFLYNHKKNKTPIYLKSVAYLSIVPFAFWWVLSPSVDRGFSPWLLIIPSWYFMFLALWQWRGIFKGGFPVFVYFNGLFVLLLSLRVQDKIQFALIITAVVFLLLSVKTPRRFPHFVVSSFLAILLGVGFYAGTKILYEWRQGHRYSGHYAEKQSKRNLMGFSPVAKLGSFMSNYVGEENSEVVFRVFTQTPPQYLRGIAYGNYSRGLWKETQVKDYLLPEFYVGDYAAFAIEDSIVETVWVQSPLNTFGYGFAPLKSGVAFHAADSIENIPGNVFRYKEDFVKDWYYVKGSKPALDTFTTPFLKVSDKLDSLLTVIENEIGVSNDSTASEKANKIKRFFFENFEYSLVLPTKNNQEPLEIFWNSKKGFCEYFATLSTLILRHQGIPARYVVGFSHPVPSPSKDYYIFLRKHSHAWVEYYEGNEWKILDPTPGGAVDLLALDSYAFSFGESFKVKSMQFMQFLKNGEWRRSLDSWTLFLEKLLKSIYVWIFVTLLILVLLLQKARRYLKKKQVETYSAKVVELQKLLKQAETILSKFGILRNPGETVSCFLLRLKGFKPKENKVKLFEKAISNLKKYEMNRWKKEN